MIEEKRVMRNMKEMKVISFVIQRGQGSCPVLAKEWSVFGKSFRSQVESDAKIFEGMARTYFDQYCWEVQRRKEVMKREKLTNTRIQQ